MLGVSLRVRLLIVAALAVIALAIAIVTVLGLVADRESLGVREAARSNEVALGALAAAVTADDPIDHATLDGRARGALAPMIDTRGGYCWADDYIWEQSADLRGQGPPHGPRGPSRTMGAGVPEPPPNIRAAVLAACARVAAGEREELEVTDRMSTTAIALRRVRPGVVAFAMRIVWGGRRDERTSPALIAITLATVIAIALTLHALWSLRRGLRQLSGNLAALQANPRADIARPQPIEIGAISDDARALAGRLADAQQRQLELERADAHQRRMSSLGHLVAGIAHEVRNPLTGIKLVLDGIGRRASDDRTRADVATAAREIARLDKLVTASLGVARDAPTELVDCDLRALVDERCAGLAAHAEPRGVSIACSGHARARVDRDALVRILDNLLRNAVDASPDGERVMVEIDAAGVIDVIDRGPGVPTDREATLFEPFVTSKADGTGLGLWMSLALAEARGGTLRYRRVDGLTHFTLALGPA